MENKKASTYIERLGFKDKDLTTPEHDKMVLFAYDNWAYILNSFDLNKLPNTKPNKIMEKPISNQNFIVGYADLWVYFDKEMSFYFEIKPEITSIGEMLRQIQTYKKYTQASSRWFIITKTKGLKELFKEQEIYVFEYEDEKIKGVDC